MLSQNNDVGYDDKWCPGFSSTKLVHVIQPNIYLMIRKNLILLYVCIL